MVFIVPLMKWKIKITKIMGLFRANEQQKNNCELKIVDESDENIVFSNRYIFINVGIEPLK